MMDKELTGMIVRMSIIVCVKELLKILSGCEDIVMLTKPQGKAMNMGKRRSCYLASERSPQCQGWIQR